MRSTGIRLRWETPPRAEASQVWISGHDLPDETHVVVKVNGMVRPPIRHMIHSGATQPLG
jgi:hypothetical protein